MSKYCSFCGTLLSDESTTCQNCGLAQRVSIHPEPSSPKTVAPEQPLEIGSLDLSKPPLRAARTSAPSPYRANPDLETCEIVYEQSGTSIRRFVAKVTGPDGETEAGRSRNLTGEALFDILDDMAGEKTAGPSSLVQANVDILLELVSKLMQAGWTPVEEKGEYWWNRKFVRLLRTDKTGDLLLPDSRQQWEPWFHGVSNRAFERKLAHQMGFDGKIRLYEIRTHVDDVDALLNGRLFLDLYIDTSAGVFLRQIRTPEDWPQTSLMFLDLKKPKFGEVFRSDSSLLNWYIHSQTDSEFVLITERRATGSMHRGALGASSRRADALMTDRRATGSRGYKIRHQGGISFEPFTV